MISRAQAEMGPSTVEEIEELDSQANGRGNWIVTVFNNDENTFDQVIGVLIKATQCSMEEALMETWEIHHLGKSVVHVADQAECERAASIIARIGIRVEATKDA